jgi:hypothetical protein
MSHPIALVAAGLFAAAGLSGCMCGQTKSGTVESVNSYCVVQNDDPVDPAIAREYKGQKVGFCCNGCPETWDAMTDAQKDEALRVAVAKGTPR